MIGSLGAHSSIFLRLVALGTPVEMKAALGVANATLDDVFIHYAGGLAEAEGAFRLSFLVTGSVSISSIFCAGSTWTRPGPG